MDAKDKLEMVEFLTNLAEKIESGAKCPRDKTRMSPIGRAACIRDALHSLELNDTFPLLGTLTHELYNYAGLPDAQKISAWLKIVDREADQDASTNEKH